MSALEFSLAADHPAASGHFAGNPMIPGAVLLSEALRAVGAALGTDLARCSVRSAKFPSPSRPGDRVEIDFSASGAGISLVCSVSGRTVLKAEIAALAFARASPLHEQKETNGFPP
jgi:3-hydroxymyristoyl/3-hydroxydecanoyl-(acyl carrier protein) dehydratase